jgi:hypothetical protein
MMPTLQPVECAQNNHACRALPHMPRIMAPKTDDPGASMHEQHEPGMGFVDRFRMPFVSIALHHLHLCA